MRRILFLLIVLCCTIALYAQENKIYLTANPAKATVYIPNVGDTIRDYTFTDVINYHKKSVSISDYRGKWLVLDWWGVGCVSCVLSMPKLNKIQEDFKDSANILMVGQFFNDKTKRGSGIKDYYKIFEKKKNLELTVAFDSASFEVFGVIGVPFSLIVDPHGIIRAKTFTIDSAMLAGFISGKNMPFKYAYTQEEKSHANFNFFLPLLTKGEMSNGGVDTSFIFRSLISKWDPSCQLIKAERGFSSDSLVTLENDKVVLKALQKGKAEAIGMDLPSLIRLAYTGKKYPTDNNELYTRKIFLETERRKLFEDGNELTGENMYNYSLITPGWSLSMLRSTMLDDVEKNFQFKTTVEIRKVPVYKLIVVNDKKAQKLKTRGGVPGFNPIGSTGAYQAVNWSIEILASSLGKAVILKDNISFPKIVDSTNISYNIDITMPAGSHDYEGIMKELNNYGLALVKGEIPVKCIVVKDIK